MDCREPGEVQLIFETNPLLNINNFQIEINVLKTSKLTITCVWAKATHEMSGRER